NIAQRPRCWYFRSNTFPCARKEGNTCYAQKGENKYHAIFDNGDCAVVHASSLAAPLVALDAVVVTTKRKIPIEKFFVPTTVDIAAKAAEAAFTKATPFADNGYKVPLGRTILKRAILAAAGEREIAGG